MSITQIPLDDLKKSFLFNEGAYFGSLFDFLSFDEIEHLKNLINKVKEYSIKHRDTELYCTYDYRLIRDVENNIDENIGFEHSIKLSEVNSRDLFVKENNREISQKWFHFRGFDGCKYFMEISKKILNKFYPNINIDFNQMPQFALYEDGHFIADHIDGQNVGRVCALIIYLSDDDNYNSGGGELVIKTNTNTIYNIKPTFGTFSLLDFTKNNVRHSVNSVKNGFKRYSFLYFFNEISTNDSI